jgi:hypothetical protein
MCEVRNSGKFFGGPALRVPLKDLPVLENNVGSERPGAALSSGVKKAPPNNRATSAKPARNQREITAKNVANYDKRHEISTR